VYITNFREWAETSRQTDRVPHLTSFNLKLILCTTNFNVQKFGVLLTMHLCVLRGSQNKQRLAPITALTYRFL